MGVVVLPRDYSGQACSVARALEIVGERWSLLIVRDAFFGVRRFSDFAGHLDIPRAVLTERLGHLVREGVLRREPGPGRRSEYALSEKGLDLWPVVRALTAWGDTYCAPRGPRRLFTHDGCGGAIATDGRCARCAADVAITDTLLSPGPGYEPPSRDDPVTVALSRPRRLLEPITR
jgi:DNA-binding HxlR family transcriptional regulator